MNTTPPPNQEQQTFLSHKRDHPSSFLTPLPPQQSLPSKLSSLLTPPILSLTKTPSINSLTLSLLRDIKPPKPDQFSISHPNIASIDMDIMKITAQFVAKNGQKFLSEISERESKNDKFNFLKPQHNLFGYFTYLVGSYSKILNYKKEKIEKLVEYSSNKESILKNANNRVMYEMKVKKMKKNKKFNEYDMMTEEELKKTKIINWYDFVVVEVINFDEPENITNDNGDNSNEKEEQNEVHIEQQQEEPNITEQYEQIEDTKYEITQQLQDEQQQQQQQQQLIQEDNDDNEQSEHSDIVIEDINDNLNHNQQEEEEQQQQQYQHQHEQNISTYDGIKVIKNYERQKHKKPTNNNNSTTTTDNSNLSDIKCPLCKQNINPNTFQQHIKLELLDPKWKEIQKEISKRQDTSALANTSEVLTYLSSFSKSRPDLFGNITDIHNFEQNKATDSSSIPNQPIWNGYNPYMSRTTANITMFKQQNKKHLEESKKAALANNNASTSKNN